MKELMIAAGSYSGVLYGMALRQEKDACAGARLVPSFSSNVHSGCIKHVAMRGSTLVSGSTDESVQCAPLPFTLYLSLSLFPLLVS